MDYSFDKCLRRRNSCAGIEKELMWMNGIGGPYGLKIPSNHTVEVESGVYIEEPLCRVKMPLCDYKLLLNALHGRSAANHWGIKKVIFNAPATIVIWNDNTKTVVKAENEIFDPEKGLAMAISKKVLGNKGNYYNTFRMHLEDAEVPMMKRPTKAEYTYAGIETLHEVLHHNKKATKAELLDAIDKAIGYLDKALED